MNASPSPGPSRRLIGSVVILILAAVALYYLYDYLYNTTQLVVKADILGGSQASSPRAAGPLVYPGSSQSSVNLSQYIFTGGTTSINFWIYVTKPPSSTAGANIISLGVSAAAAVADVAATATAAATLGSTAVTEDNLLIVGLGSASNNSLVVKVKDSAATTTIDVLLNNTTNSNPDKPSNIKNFELGRWVNVAIVLNNNLVDVYTDGKLSRSSILNGPFQVPAGSLKFTMLPTGTGGSWSGSLSAVSFFNIPLSPADVYNIYMAGPSGGQGDLMSKIKSFFGLLESYIPTQ